MRLLRDDDDLLLYFPIRDMSEMWTYKESNLRCESCVGINVDMPIIVHTGE